MNGGEEEAEKGIWTTAATLMLIALYKEINKPKMKRKTLWENLSTELNKHGYDFTVQKIENNWKSRKNAYRKKKDNAKRTGEGRTTFQFESQLDDIYGEDHDTEPVYLAGTDIKQNKRSLEGLLLLPLMRR